ncbi:hypothetical protein BDB01DRAFT_847855 [Pilobolus umbonatus]|nr:hypothetical protein BDB01DRAFT_847855 [Pilobolus umbonatus]
MNNTEDISVNSTVAVDNTADNTVDNTPVHTSVDNNKSVPVIDSNISVHSDKHGGNTPVEITNIHTDNEQLIDIKVTVDAEEEKSTETTQISPESTAVLTMDPLLDTHIQSDRHEDNTTVDSNQTIYDVMDKDIDLESLSERDLESIILKANDIIEDELANMEDDMFEDEMDQTIDIDNIDFDNEMEDIDTNMGLQQVIDLDSDDSNSKEDHMMTDIDVDEMIYDEFMDEDIDIENADDAILESSDIDDIQLEGIDSPEASDRSITMKHTEFTTDEYPVTKEVETGEISEYDVFDDILYEDDSNNEQAVDDILKDMIDEEENTMKDSDTLDDMGKVSNLNTIDKEDIPTKETDLLSDQEESDINPPKDEQVQLEMGEDAGTDNRVEEGKTEQDGLDRANNTNNILPGNKLSSPIADVHHSSTEDKQLTPLMSDNVDEEAEIDFEIEYNKMKKDLLPLNESTDYEEEIEYQDYTLEGYKVESASSVDASNEEEELKYQDYALEETEVESQAMVVDSAKEDEELQDKDYTLVEDADAAKEEEELEYQDYALVENQAEDEVAAKEEKELEYQDYALEESQAENADVVKEEEELEYQEHALVETQSEDEVAAEEEKELEYQDHALVEIQAELGDAAKEEEKLENQDYTLVETQAEDINAEKEDNEMDYQDYAVVEGIDAAKEEEELEYQDYALEETRAEGRPVADDSSKADEKLHKQDSTSENGNEETTNLLSDNKHPNKTDQNDGNSLDISQIQIPVNEHQTDTVELDNNDQVMEEDYANISPNNGINDEVEMTESDHEGTKVHMEHPTTESDTKSDILHPSLSENRARQSSNVSEAHLSPKPVISHLHNEDHAVDKSIEHEDHPHEDHVMDRSIEHEGHGMDALEIVEENNLHTSTLITDIDYNEIEDSEVEIKDTHPIQQHESSFTVNDTKETEEDKREEFNTLVENTTAPTDSENNIPPPISTTDTTEASQIVDNKDTNTTTHMSPITTKPNTVEKPTMDTVIRDAIDIDIVSQNEKESTLDINSSDKTLTHISPSEIVSKEPHLENEISNESTITTIDKQDEGGILDGQLTPLITPTRQYVNEEDNDHTQDTTMDIDKIDNENTLQIDDKQEISTQVPDSEQTPIVKQKEGEIVNVSPSIPVTADVVEETITEVPSEPPSTPFLDSNNRETIHTDEILNIIPEKVKEVAPQPTTETTGSTDNDEDIDLVDDESLNKQERLMRFMKRVCKECKIDPNFSLKRKLSPDESAGVEPDVSKKPRLEPAKYSIFNDREALLDRLSTYSVNFFLYPRPVSALQCSLHGWVDCHQHLVDDSNTHALMCRECNGYLPVNCIKGSSSNSLTRLYRLKLLYEHKEGCQWRNNKCQTNIYRFPKLVFTEALNMLKTRARDLMDHERDHLSNIVVEHHLNETVFSNLQFVIRDMEGHETDHITMAYLLAISGWQPLDKAVPGVRCDLCFSRKGFLHLTEKFDLSKEHKPYCPWINSSTARCYSNNVSGAGSFISGSVWMQEIIITKYNNMNEDIILDHDHIKHINKGFSESRSLIRELKHKFDLFKQEIEASNK